MTKDCYVLIAEFQSDLDVNGLFPSCLCVELGHNEPSFAKCVHSTEQGLPADTLLQTLKDDELPLLDLGYHFKPTSSS